MFHVLVMIWLKKILNILQLKVNVRNKKMKLRKLSLIKRFQERQTHRSVTKVTVQGSQPKKENRVEKIESEMKNHEETKLIVIKMPPNILKREKPKGAKKQN